MSTSNLQQFLANTTANLQHLLHRAEAQIEFAQTLCELHPDQAPAWQPAIDQARQLLSQSLAAGHLDNMATAVADVERTLSPLAKTAKSYTAHCVGHAHIDMNWMWSWQETVQITVDSFATVLRLMDEFPEFTFSQSQASTYQLVERHRPDLLRQIADRVKQGRWEVLASHWVETDKNMASAESLCRHLLYTRAYMKQLFGLRPQDVTIDWAPDTFGHPATMATYLSRAGIKYMYLHRPGVHTTSKPGAFWWESPDGARLLVRNDMRAAYNGIIGPAVIVELVRLVKLTGGRDAMFVYGVGDHGGGPTRRDLRMAIELNTWPVYPQIKFSTAKKFFERLEKQADNLPVIHGELNTEFTGCYTTQTLIKKANRLSENRLADTEYASVLAMRLAGHPYPADRLLEGWRHTLFSHFHDILPGSGVHDTRTYTHGLFQEIMAITGTAETDALRRVAALVDTRLPGWPALEIQPAWIDRSGFGAGVGFASVNGGVPRSDQSHGTGPRPFVIFNPTPRDRHEVIEVTIWDNGEPGNANWKTKHFVAHASDGTVVPAQQIKSGRYWTHEYLTLSFPVTVPGFGYARYVVTEADKPATEPEPVARQIGFTHHCSYAPVERSIEGLENDRLRVEFDPITGGIRSLVDKITGLQLIDVPAASPILEYGVERAHTFTAWTVDHTGSIELPTVTALRREHHEGHRASIVFDMKIRASTMRVTYELRAGDPRLHIGIKGTWFERGTADSGIPVLRMVVPLALSEASGRYEIPFGAADRAHNHGEELPALQWAQVTGACDGQPAGCLLLNDSKHGHSLNGNTLRLTLVRSSYDPDPLPDIGEHEVNVALYPFAGELPVTDAIAMGQAYNHPLRVVSTDTHDGNLEPTGQFFSVTPASVTVMAVKKCEANNSVLVRLLNPTGEPVTARVALSKQLAGKIASAQEVDLIERPVRESRLKLAAHAVTLPVPANAPATVIIRLAK